MTDDKVVSFPTKEKSEVVSPDERMGRLRAEVERLARMPTVDWMLSLEDTAKRHGIAQTKLKTMVNAVARQARNERAAREKQERKDRAERDDAFKALRCLPRVEHEAGLARLARRLGKNVAVLRREFTSYAGVEDEAAEAWPEPVDARELLDAIIAQVRRYAVVSDDIAITVALWTMFAWVHDVAVHSPLLVLTSAEADTGKSTVAGVMRYLVPRPHSAVELTGPGLFRMVDLLRPTLFIDENDDLLQRKRDLMHVINAGWTRGTKIPRVVKGEPCLFDPFCPKVLAMKGLNLASTTASRAIVCKLVPKLEQDEVAIFAQVDDEEFRQLRLRLARWSVDHLDAFENARPAMPPGFVNRLAANWWSLFVIADLARHGRRARAAAVRLSRGERERRSEGIRLLETMRRMFAHREVLTSAKVVAALIADEEGEWAQFRGRGPITKRQVALLLAPYDIHPIVVHPGGRSTSSARGYKRTQFFDAFARYLRRQVSKRTPKAQKLAKNGAKAGCTVAQLKGGRIEASTKKHAFETDHDD